MKSFKQFLNEETMPYATNARGVIDIEDSSVRDGLNSQLAGVTAGKFITPYIALERVTKALANYHIFIPRHSFLEGDSGMFVWPINQFGIKFGQQDNGTFVQDGEVLKDTSKGSEIEGEDFKTTPEPNKEVDKPFSIFFEYRQSDCGMFNVFSEVVSQEELDEILADLEAEMNDDGEEEDEDELNEQTTPSTFSQARAGVGGASATTGVTPRSYSDSDGTTPRDNTSKGPVPGEIKGPVPGEIPEPKMQYKDDEKNIKEEKIKKIIEACWKGYRKEGMKTMFGKKYPNCVKDD